MQACVCAVISVLLYFDSLIKISKTKMKVLVKKHWFLKVNTMENKMEWNVLGIKAASLPLHLDSQWT